MSERIDKLEERIEALEDHTQDIDEEWMNAPAGPYPDAPKQVHACEFCGCDIEHGERVCSAACLDMLINEFIDNQEQAQPDSPTDEPKRLHAKFSCNHCGDDVEETEPYVEVHSYYHRGCELTPIEPTIQIRRDNKELAAAREEIERLKATLAAKERVQSLNEEEFAEEIKELKDENKLLNEAYDILQQINSDIDPRDVLMENATLEGRIEKAYGIAYEGLTKPYEITGDLQKIVATLKGETK